MMQKNEIGELPLYLYKLIQRNPPIQDKKEVAKLIEQWRNHGDRQAYDRLVYGNIRLVMSIALKYANRGTPLIDLIQEGVIGLMRALDKFDPQLGYKLSTYATLWIRQAVSTVSSGQKRPFFLPQRLELEVWLIKRALNSFFEKFGWWPNDEEVFNWIHTLDGAKNESKAVKSMTIKKIKICRCILTDKFYSLNAPIKPGMDVIEELTFGDIIAYTKADAETIMEVKQELAELNAAAKRLETEIDKLDSRTSVIIRSHLQKKITLAELGKYFKLSRERVRQIEKRGVEKIVKELKITKEKLKQLINATNELAENRHSADADRLKG